MKDLKEIGFHGVKQPQSQTKLTKEQEQSQKGKGSLGKPKCNCMVPSGTSLPNPCDSVPHDVRISELTSKFLQKGVCTCEGLEYVAFHFPVQHPDFGKLARCICVRESQTQSKKDFLVKSSRLTENKTFSDFQIKLNPNCKEGYDMAFEWAQGRNTPMVMLYGQTGVGKTHLAVAASWVKIGLGKPVLFYSAAELVRKMQSGVNDGTLDETISSVKSAQNLVLDDLGREYTTNWTTAIFHEIIDYRYNNRNDINTFITTNHSLSELETILGVPVVSRLTDHVASSVVIMDGQDVRNKDR